MTVPHERYPTVGSHWRRRFGERVWRVTVDAGLSCPNRDGTLATGGCTFCDPASFSPAAGSSRPVRDQLADGFRRLRERGKAGLFAAYFQPHTNTHAPVERLRELWDTAAEFPEVVSLCVGTRPDCVPDAVLDLLAGYRKRFEVWLELGLQSSRDATLARVRRGHTAEAFADGCRRARERGLLVCAHVVLGLPGEGPDHERETARFLRETGAEGVKVHQLAVVEGTPLAQEWREGAVRVLSQDDYVARAAAFVLALSPATVLHRLCGDTRPDRLLAPRYDKRQVVVALRQRLGADSC